MKLGENTLLRRRRVKMGVFLGVVRVQSGALLVGWWEWSRIFRQICALLGTQTNGAHTELVSIGPELMQIPVPFP
jgi:hypothetical protein